MPENTADRVEAKHCAQFGGIRRVRKPVRSGVCWMGSGDNIVGTEGRREKDVEEVQGSTIARQRDRVTSFRWTRRGVKDQVRKEGKQKEE